MTNLFSLENKTILITGASSGIGKATSIICSELGANLIVLGRNEIKLNNTLLQLNGSTHSSFIGDLNEKVFIEDLVNKCPLLDGIVHSAGIIEYLPSKFYTPEKISKVININYTMPFYFTNLLLKQKKIKNNSSIVFLSSISGVKGGGQAISSYAGSKAALIGTSKIMALEVAKQNIRVNCIAPGMVETEMTEATQKSLSEEAINKDKLKYPLGYGDPKDIANAIVFLLSDASRWITGTTLIIDGGFSCN
ncbi:MAG: SDR family oxidoreductase [Ignavibacteriae bacterium]|nr:SDR family oxidoreductase [Ignavibacteriota bacterium]